MVDRSWVRLQKVSLIGYPTSYAEDITFPVQFKVRYAVITVFIVRSFKSPMLVLIPLFSYCGLFKKLE